MISLLSGFALALVFAGCGQSGSVSSNDGTAGSTTTDAVTGAVTTGGSTSDEGNGVVVNNGSVQNTTITNEFGLNPSLGTPPPLPSS